MLAYVYEHFLQTTCDDEHHQTLQFNTSFNEHDLMQGHRVMRKLERLWSFSQKVLNQLTWNLVCRWNIWICWNLQRYNVKRQLFKRDNLISGISWMGLGERETVLYLDVYEQISF